MVKRKGTLALEYDKLKAKLHRCFEEGLPHLCIGRGSGCAAKIQRGLCGGLESG